MFIHVYERMPNQSRDRLWVTIVVLPSVGVSCISDFISCTVWALKLSDRNSGTFFGSFYALFCQQYIDNANCSLHTNYSHELQLPWVMSLSFYTKLCVRYIYMLSKRHMTVNWEVREHPAGDRFSCIQLAIWGIWIWKDLDISNDVYQSGQLFLQAPYQ